ncbi:hypothetical protein Tco_0278450 [Tanacetum coccineum]
MSPPKHAYQSQLAYHQNQQYGFQGYTNPRNTQPHFFSQLSFFSQQSSQPQFKIPQAQEPREPKRKQKRTGKQQVVELDEGDENEDMETRRLNIRWNDKEEILLAEAWIEHSQDNNIGKDQRDEIYWNKIIEDFHDRTTGPVRTKNMLTGKWARMHGDCQRFNAYYKQENQKSGENEADFIETVKTVYLERVDYRRKCDVAQRAYEVQMEKDLAIKKCEEMKFLMIDTSNLSPHKRAFIERHQAKIMRKYQDAGADDAGADD